MLVAGWGKRIGMRVAWRERLRLWPAQVMAAAASLVLVSCTQTAPPAGRGAASRSGGVISLNEISTLKSLFNRDNGHPRLVLIFSPT
jgi:hypothetical protein